MHRCDYILSCLRRRFPSAAFLEGHSKAVYRYESKRVIIFRYVANNRYYVIKYYSFEHLVGQKRLKEKQSIRDEYLLAKDFQGHNNVINVYAHDVLIAGGQEIGAYYSMDFFALTLDKLLSEGHIFRPQEVMSFLHQMDNVLCHAHFKLGIIHSDIKPANIGVVRKGSSYTYKLMDFDVAARIEKEPSSGHDLNYTISDKIHIRGMTPAYAAPEQVLAQINPETPITGKADTYSVGAIALQMLTGKPPKPNANTLFYQLPLQYLPGKWYDIFSQICHPEIRYRPRKIIDVLGQRQRTYRPNTSIKSKKPEISNTYGLFLLKHIGETDKKKAIALAALFLSGLSLIFLLVAELRVGSGYQAEHSAERYPSAPETSPDGDTEKGIDGKISAETTYTWMIDEKNINDTEPQEVQMPDLVGQPLSEAQLILNQNGIQKDIIFQHSGPQNVNVVLNTIPESGRAINKDNDRALLVIGQTP